MKKSNYYQIFQFRGRELIDSGVLTAEDKIRVPFKSFCALLENKFGSTLSEEKTDILRSSIADRSIIKIPYSEVLSKIYKAKEVKCRTDSPDDQYYYQKSLF